jgi:hypothetical protein
MKLYLINNLLKIYIETSDDTLMHLLKTAFLKYKWSFENNLECKEKNETNRLILVKKEYKECPYLF